MALRDATVWGRSPPSLPAGPPYACSGLHPWVDLPFDLPPSDPRLRALHEGGPEPTPPLANLAGAFVAWAEWPEHMDFCAADSPMRAQKELERALYLRRWDVHVPAGCRVLDVGGGIGRFTTWCLARGCDVDLVDPDLRSLRRAVTHAAGLPGRLDVHWATGESMPDLGAFDVVIAAEVLNYVEDPVTVVAKLRRALKPGGALLFSAEARWGWALAYDVPKGTLDALLGDGVVHVPGDKWVRTFDRAALTALLADFTIERLDPTHYLPSGPFEDAAGVRSPDEVERWEARLREHPVTAPLHRAWIGVAR